MRYFLSWACIVAAAVGQVAGGGTEQEVWWGRINGTDVRVRGGPADIHAVLATLSQDMPVRVVGRSGDWLQVDVPGGIPAYVATRRAGRSYVQELDPGQGLVVVNDLQLRGTAGTDFPPLGEVNAGDRLVMIERHGDWARVVAPGSVKGFVYATLVTADPDAAAAEARFAELHARRYQETLLSGELSRQLVEREAASRELEAAAEAAVATFEAEQAKASGERDIDAVREALEVVIAAAPEGDPLRRQAELRLETLNQWEAAQSEIADAERSLDAVRREAASAETLHAEDLQRLRVEVTERQVVEARERAAAAAPYRATGWLRRTFPVSGVIEKGSPFAIFQGNRRQFVLESERYDLSEYEGMLIGIAEAQGPFDRPGVKVRILLVDRLEILGKE